MAFLLLQAGNGNDPDTLGKASFLVPLSLLSQGTPKANRKKVCWGSYWDNGNYYRV